MNQTLTHKSLPDSTPLATQLSSRLADRENCHPLDLPPLYDAIDLENAQSILSETNTTELTFTYLTYEITLTDTDTIHITEQDRV